MTFAITDSWLDHMGEAVKISDDRLEDVRKERVKFLRHYSGKLRNPMNIMQWNINVLVPMLLYHGDIEALITSRQPELEPEGLWHSQKWNALSRQIRLGNTMMMAVIDAMFGPSIIKTGLSTVARWDRDGGVLHDAYQPYADLISLDDYIIDPRAKKREQAAFEGHRIYMSRQSALDSGLYDNGVLERMAVIGKPRDEQARDITTQEGRMQSLDEHDETICMVELWLPRENVVVTLTHGDKTELLREVQWDGPEEGPFDMLSLFPLPDNVFGVSQASMLYDLHMDINRVAKKLVRGMLQQKDIAAIGESVSDAEAEAVKTAEHGDMVRMQDPSKVNTISIGGPNKDLYGGVAFLMQQVQRQGNNPEMLGGSQSASQTATQDQMLMDSANVRVSTMRMRFQEFANNVGRKLFLWNQQLAIEEAANDPQQLQVEITLPDGRTGQYSLLSVPDGNAEFDFRVDLYGRAPDSPEARANRLIQYGNMAAQFLPLLQQQGVGFDAQAYFDELGRLGDIPNHQRFWLSIGAPPQAVQPGSEVSQEEEGPARRRLPGGKTQEEAVLEEIGA